MLISNEIYAKLLDLFFNLSVNVAIEAHKYLNNNSNISGYLQYPIRDRIFDLLLSNPEEYQHIDYVKYKIIKYHLDDFPKDRIQYGAIFNGYGNKININEIQGYAELSQFILETTEVCEIFFENGEAKNSDYKIKHMVSEIVERYLYNTSATNETPDNLKELILPYVIEKINRYVNEQLYFDILVPICLATFDEDKIVLSSTAEIVRIPDDIQKSRQQACNYESVNENWIAACATHMLVLHGYYLKNEKYISINYLTQNYNLYPLNEIDYVMAAIRIATGYNIGYNQIISKPIDWVDSTKADLIPLYGAKSNFVNGNEIHKSWVALSIKLISNDEIKKIQTLYNSILTINESVKDKDNKKNNLLFALKRLNRCYLRVEEDDMVTDATIGLEALLSGGTKGEITYTISNRIPVVFSNGSELNYPIKECRTIMKKIYECRSIIVHGGTMKENKRYHKIGDLKIDVMNASVNFLRQTLLFILNNPKYLDAKEFDKHIDDAILVDLI